MKLLTPLIVVLSVLASPLLAEVVKVEEKDQIILERFLGHARATAKSMTPERAKKTCEIPETFCWVELPELSMSLTAYELTGNIEHLTDFTAAIKVFRDVQTKGPEGRLGWWGKPIESLMNPATPDVKITEIQAAFRMIGVLARFVEIIDRDPALAKQFAAERTEYLSLAENDLYKQWEANYSDLGDKGGVYRWLKEYTPKKANLTLSHEKHSILVEAILNLYRVTGDKQYRERAEKLGTFLKSKMRDVDGHYVWNFWDVAGAWDVEDGKPRSWVNVEPKGMWFAATARSASLLYHHGLVFDDADMRKIARTQMEVCWNGDLEKPVFSSASGAKVEKERFIAPALAPWAPKLKELIYSGLIQQERIDKSNSPWTGGVLTSDWLREKYIELPKTANADPSEPVKPRYVK